MKNGKCMCRDCLKGGLSNSYSFVCYFRHHSKSNIFAPVFKTTPFKCYTGSMSQTLDAFRCLLVANLAALCRTILS